MFIDRCRRGYDPSHEPECFVQAYVQKLGSNEYHKWVTPAVFFQVPTTRGERSIGGAAKNKSLGKFDRPPLFQPLHSSIITLKLLVLVRSSSATSATISI